MAEAVDLSAAGATLARSWTPALALSVPGTSSWTSDPGAPAVGRYTKAGGLLIAQFQISATPTLGTGSGYLKVIGPDDAFASPPSGIIDASGGFLTQRTGVAIPSGYGGVGLQGIGNASAFGLDFVLMASKSDGTSAALMGAADMASGVEIVLSGTFIYWLS